MPRERKSVKVLRVIDGDTVDVLNGPGFFHRAKRERIRLYGIDAPESAQAGGKDATNYLKKIIGSGKKIWLEPVAKDKYGRTVGVIYRRRGNPKESYNYQMVQAGQARCYMLAKTDQAHYEQAQKKAQEKRWGLWHQPRADAPWNYRAAQPRRASRARSRTILLMASLTILAATLTFICNNQG